MLCVLKLLHSPPPPRPPNTLQTTASGMEVYLQKHIWSHSLRFSHFYWLHLNISISPQSFWDPAGICGTNTAALLFDCPAEIRTEPCWAIKLSQAWMCYSYRLVKICAATFGNITSWHNLVAAPAANQRWLFLPPSAVELNQRWLTLSGCQIDFLTPISAFSLIPLKNHLESQEQEQSASNSNTII